MPCEIYDINDIKSGEEPDKPARFLYIVFGEKIGRAIWCFLWDVWLFFAKLLVYLTLPFMFFYFFFNARKKRTKHNATFPNSDESEYE